MRKYRRLSSIQGGFTLAEVLIALALLGVIATFSLPKVLYVVGEQQKIALFRETIAVLSESAYQGILRGDLNSANMFTYFSSHLNTRKVCPNNAQTEGCWPGSTDMQANEATRPGMILANGAYITDFGEGGSFDGDSLSIDFNGVDGPNLTGQDQLRISIVLENFTEGSALMEPGLSHKAGTAVRGIFKSSHADSHLFPVNNLLWSQILNN